MTSYEKTKAPTVGAAGAPKKTQSQQQSSSLSIPTCSAKVEECPPSISLYAKKSTAGDAQRQRILQMLRVRPHNGYEMRRAGCWQYPTRIWELIHRFGYVIESARVTIVDQDSFTHHGVALYSLVAEPTPEVAVSSAPNEKGPLLNEVAP